MPGFLDFIKNRNASQPQAAANQSQEQKPETAKQMYTREAAQEKARPSLESQIAQEQLAKAREAGARLDAASRYVDHKTSSPTPAPADSASSPEALRQNMSGQDRAAAALSPTTERTGKPAEKSAQVQQTEPPAKEQAQSASRPQSMPRPRPSWER